MPVNRRTVLALLAASPFAALPGFAEASELFGSPEDAAAVAAALYARMPPTGDLVASPFSMRAAFVLAYAGAAGATADEIASVLRFPAYDRLARLPAATPAPPAEEGRPRLEVANTIWPDVHAQLRPAYLALLHRIMNTTVTTVDYRDPDAAAATINRFVTEATHGRIDHLLTADNVRGASAVLTNAIYFKAKWAAEFEREATATGDFTVSPGQILRTDLMHQVGRLRLSTGSDFVAADLPYVGGDYAMSIILPVRVDGLADIEHRLMAGGQLGGVLAALAASPMARVALTLPRFKIVAHFSLKSALQAMGVSLAFIDGRADFSRLSDVALHIDDVIQQAFIEVDEAGTEAAAATAITMVATGSFIGPPEPPPIPFRADHPFLYVLRDTRDGAILFMGRVERPTAPPRPAASPPPAP